MNDATVKPKVRRTVIMLSSFITISVATVLFFLSVPSFWLVLPVGFGILLPVSLGITMMYETYIAEEETQDQEKAMQQLKSMYVNDKITESEFDRRMDKLLDLRRSGTDVSTVEQYSEKTLQKNKN